MSRASSQPRATPRPAPRVSKQKEPKPMASSLCAKVLLAGGLIGLLAGCTASGDEVRPPRDQFFFPTALSVTPDESKLFVVSSNSNLRYDSGSVAVIDLDAVDALIASRGSGEERCTRDPIRPEVLQCDEALVIPDPEAGVRIGNYATAVGVQELASGDLRLFVPVRGDPSITWIDYRDGELSCEGTEAVPLCGTSNRMTHQNNDPALSALVNEPFGLYVDSAGGYAVVSHLSSAAASLIDAPADGSPPQLVDALTGLFGAAQNQIPSAVGVAGRPSASGETLVYVTSRSESRVYMLSVLRSEGRAAALVPAEYFFLDDVAPSDNSRGIAFEEGGERGYIVNRNPPMLHVLDTASGAEGFPRNRITATVEICRDPANVVVADTGRGPRVYVSCFPAGQVWVMNPDLAKVEAVIDVGRGPHALTVSPDRKRLYVGNFLEDTIAVVDLTAGAETENRMVLRLGAPLQAEDY